MPEFEPFSGAFMLEGPVSAVDIWQMLHSNAAEWAKVPRDANFFRVREMLDQADREACRKLREFDAGSWEHLCSGAGWTLLGAIALSWCRGADQDRVLGYLHAVSSEIGADEGTLRSAALFCPRLLPDARKLSEIAQAFEGNVFKIAVVLAVLQSEVLIDVEADSLIGAPFILRPLVTKILQGQDRMSDFQAVINHWNGEVATAS